MKRSPDSPGLHLFTHPADDPTFIGVVAVSAKEFVRFTGMTAPEPAGQGLAEGRHPSRRLDGVRTGIWDTCRPRHRKWPESDLGSEARPPLQNGQSHGGRNSRKGEMAPPRTPDRGAA